MLQQMVCQHCKSFLHDFLHPELHKDLDLAKRLHKKRLTAIRSCLADWIFTIYSKLNKEDFDSSLRLASCIAQRGRPPIEYEFVVLCATFRLLKCKVPWLANELGYMKVLLLEQSLFQKNNKSVLATYADDYLAYITSRTLVALYTLHDDHLNPKGILSNTNQLLHTPMEIVIDDDEMYS